MAELYAEVINNVIVWGPSPLPYSYKNISNIGALTDVQLANINIYPAFRIAAPVYDEFEYNLQSQWVFTGVQVEQSYSLFTKTTQEKRDYLDAQTASFQGLLTNSLSEINTRADVKLNSMYGATTKDSFFLMEREIREIKYITDASQSVTESRYPIVKAQADRVATPLVTYALTQWTRLQSFYSKSADIEVKRSDGIEQMQQASNSQHVNDILDNLGL